MAASTRPDERDQVRTGGGELDGRLIRHRLVDEGKTCKNRVHVCLRPDAPRDAEVERAIGLSATVLEDRRGEDDRSWVVLADPEGNEFCMLHHGLVRS